MKATKKKTIKNSYPFEAPLLTVKKNPSCNEQIPNPLNLSEYLTPRGANSFLVSVSGDSMIDANIYDGDILVVDAAEKPKNGSIVIASLNGEMAVKYFKVIDSKAYLISANKRYVPIAISEYYEFKIQGVVKHVIKYL